MREPLPLKDQRDVWRLRAAVARLHHERLLMTLRATHLTNPHSWTSKVYLNASEAWERVKWKEPKDDS